MEEYSRAGFIFTSLTTGIMFQDFVTAFILGIVGAAGGYTFKLIKDYLEKKKKDC